ncbi:MAG: hypothetical protein QF472_06710 [Candidatus Marinimicrobia bacterium]|nr:hypothetical protein [Candidatus Neomarinimicrobiota bacterium]MDP6853626.1 hypothetical protein [Candidatus Neomarinimicrobiota bacterium]
MKKTKIIPIIILIIGSSLTAGELSIFSAIESHLSRYRQKIEPEDVQIVNGVLQVNLIGRRTNIRSQMLVGFFSTGRALYKGNYPFKEIRITIHYSLKESQSESLTASAELVSKLAGGQLNSEQFFAKLEY